MAVELYRQGTTHTRNGIECEAEIFNEYSFVDMLDADWFLTPEEVYIEVPSIKEETANAETKKVEKPVKKTRKRRTKKVKNDNQS